MNFELQSSNEYSSTPDDVSVQLAIMRDNLQRRTHSHYPEPSERLVADISSLERDGNGRLIVPDGPWTVDSHPDQPLFETAPTAERQAELIAQGYELDSKGRPLHPWFARMIGDPLIGVVLGKGLSWNWAKNSTVDMLIRKRGHVLLQQRLDTGEWGLPGGYLEPGESAAEAGPRETEEETGVAIPQGSPLVEFYRGPVADIRATANAWQDTVAIAVELPEDGPLPEVRPQLEEVAHVMWVPEERLADPSMEYHSSARFLLAKGLGMLSLAQMGGTEGVQ